MERLRSMRNIIWIIAAILLFQILFFVYMFWPLDTYFGIGLLVILILCAYLIRISLSLIKELGKKEKKD